jgi:hypothetical protein
MTLLCGNSFRFSTAEIVISVELEPWLHYLEWLLLRSQFIIASRDPCMSYVYY